MAALHESFQTGGEGQESETLFGQRDCVLFGDKIQDSGVLFDYLLKMF